MATPNAQRPIVVDEPKAQQTIKSPVRIAGLAIAFEGTVRAEVVDDKGTVLAQGFTTASAGGPEVGTYALTLQFTAPTQAAPGTVRVFADDPRTGGRAGLVEIPVTLSK
ncbi:MAG: Gmad2 immunoglobulin-like domain-containing protein [Chloroflexota bacterium]